MDMNDGAQYGNQYALKAGQHGLAPGVVSGRALAPPSPQTVQPEPLAVALQRHEATVSTLSHWLEVLESRVHPVLRQDPANAAATVPLRGGGHSLLCQKIEELACQYEACTATLIALVDRLEL